MKLRFSIILLLFTCRAMAQQPGMVYEDKTYLPEIKTVQFYNTKKESSFPLMTLNSGEQMLLAFDDLSGQSKILNYTLEHCDAQWTPSRISPIEYLQGFTEDRLMDYRYSAATRQKYIHYELTLPNQNMTPKLAGNYLLKVYQDGDQRKPVITRRLYVLGNKVSIAAGMVPSNNVSLRSTNQKINFSVEYAGLNVQNPYVDIRTLVMQNARPETGIWNTRPANIRGTQLIYNDMQTNDFPGRNEFRHFDTRSLQLNSERIQHIYRDTANTVILLPDPKRDQSDYVFQYDNDGKFFAINQDGSRDSRTGGDYAHVYFTLLANKTSFDGSAYIVGQFNNFRLDEQSKLKYDGAAMRFYTDLFLKQGVYDYEYVWVDAKTQKPDDTILEGSHFETENEYQVLVYFRAPGARWEELVGYSLVTTRQ